MDERDTTLHLMFTKGRSCLFGGRASMVLDFFIAAQIIVSLLLAPRTEFTKSP